MRTFIAKATDVKKKWVLIDASGLSLGRVATKAASILRGKTKPIYTPHVDTGDNVIIINAAKVKLTGQKLNQKVYYRHTGYIGGIRELTAQQLMGKRPEELLEKAIKGMLPKNRLGRSLQTNYRIYSNDEHPHTSQNPEVVSF